MTLNNKLEQLCQLLMSISLIITNEKLEIDITEIIEIIDKNNPELINEVINQSEWVNINTKNGNIMINSKKVLENLYWNEGDTWWRYIRRPRFRGALSLIDSTTIDRIIYSRR